MIKLTEDEKDYMITTLKPLLQKNDFSGVRYRIQIDDQDRIGIFILEKGIDLYADLDTLSQSNIFKGIERMNIPSHIKTINNNTFSDCHDLVSVILEEGVERIGDKAFEDSRIRQIKIPKSIKQIGKGAFANCPALETVILPETVSKLPQGLFEGTTPDDIVIYTTSRKGMPEENQLRCSEDELNWYVKHLKINTDYLYEGKKLQEAWSPTTPEWLKPRLSRLAKGYTDVARKYPNDDYSYRRPRDAEYDARLDMYGILRDKDIDFETINFIECEDIPESKTDERLQLPNVGVWHFPNGQVYMQGINDNEKYNNYDSSYYDKPFVKMPFKMLREEPDAFAYFNINEVGKKDYRAQRGQRREWRTWAHSNKELVRTKDLNPNSKMPKIIDLTDFDKSGYHVIPSAKKYAETLKRLHAKEYGDTLEDLEKRLRRCFVTIQNDILGDVNWDELTGDISSIKSDIGNCLGYYQDALRSYQRCIKKIDAIERRYKDTGNEEAFIDELVQENYDSFQWSIKRTNNDLAYLEGILAKYRKVYIDF